MSLPSELKILLAVFSINVIVKKCHFDIVIQRFSQPPVSPFFKGEFDDDLTYSPLKKGVRGLFLLHFLYFSTITINISLLRSLYFICYVFL
jgi:hypothetical protein